MFYDVDIEQWLAAHSQSVERTDREIFFEHSAGDNSVLLLRSGFPNASRIPSPPKFGSFYEQYAGGFIGKGFLVIGTPFQESTRSTPGVIIPTLAEIKSTSESEGIVFQQDEFPFMTTGYMFVYSLSKDGQLRCHDRDFKKVTEGGGVRVLLEDWWHMKLADEQ